MHNAILYNQIHSKRRASGVLQMRERNQMLNEAEEGRAWKARRKEVGSRVNAQ